MTETYTIEPADDGAAISPAVLRELRDLLRDDDDLDLGVRLKDSPPAPGEQGAIPVALEIVAAAGPLSTAFAAVLIHWIDKTKLSIKVRRKDGFSITLSGMNTQEAERLIEKLDRGSGGYPDTSD